MNAFDLGPLLSTTVGFERMNRILGNLGRDVPNYPPYNIEKVGDDHYRVTMAVAGFGQKDLDIGVEDNTLTVRGSRTDRAGENGESEYLHRGIATRAFEQRFRLDEYVRVTDANLADGMLNVELVREIPEEKKPQKIAITAS